MSNWQLTNKQTNQIIDLPQDMQWVDEFEWSKVAQGNPQRTLTGALVVQRGIKQQGRPITLTGGDWVWFNRADIQTLRDWTDEDISMTLTHYDGRTFDVIWRLDEQAIQAEPVHYETPEDDQTPYFATLHLMTI